MSRLNVHPGNDLYKYRHSFRNRSQFTDSPTNAIESFTGGTQVAAFYTGDADANSVSLTDIFSFARQYLTREANAASGTAGDVLIIAAKSMGSGSTNTVKASLTWGQR